MLRISFLSRVAFICNLCLLVAWLMRHHTFIPRGDLQSTIIIAGLIMSFVINGLVNILYAILLFRGKNIQSYVAVWLATINFLFLILQFYLILIP
jgi:hypothetical protein